MHGFFSHHGIWAPGVRLMRAIGFRAKALIIATTFVVPLAWIGWQYLESNRTAIAFSASERVGVLYARAALPLIEQTLRERLALVKKLCNLSDDDPAPDVSGALAALGKIDAEHGAAMGTREAFARLKAAYQTPVPTGSPTEVMAAYAERVDSVRALLGTSNDSSNLTLDPDIDTYYLMEIAVLRLPEMLDAAAQVRSIGLLTLMGKVEGPASQRLMIERLALVRAHADGIQSSLARAVGATPGIAREVDAAPALAAVKAFGEAIDREVLRPGGAQGDIAAHIQRSNAMLATLATLADRSSAQLDERIAQRVSTFQGARNISLAILLAGLAGAVYLFVCFRKVLEGGLREVARHIDAMRDGDLTTTPRPWGQDEAATLMVTLSQMQASLRHIVTEVRQASDSIGTASAQIASGALDLSARTEKSASHLQQTASAMEQITATVNNNEAAVQEVTRLARSNAEVAERGSRIVGEVVETMGEINASSVQIGDIIGTIDSIAFQTNILALNAAVEAARAGDQGRGFAVVASEVRALARRSSAAAREIKQLIDRSVGQVESGTRVVREAGATIGEMVGTARRVRELLSEVAEGAREQKQGVALSAQSVHELDVTTQRNAAMVEQTAAAAGTLQDQAQVLASAVASFRV